MTTLDLKGDMVACPKCGEQIYKLSAVCDYCGCDTYQFVVDRKREAASLRSVFRNDTLLFFTCAVTVFIVSVLIAFFIQKHI